MSIHLHLLFHTYTALYLFVYFPKLFNQCLFLASCDFHFLLLFSFILNPSDLPLDCQWTSFFLKHSHCFALTEMCVCIICNIHSKSSHFLPLKKKKKKCLFWMPILLGLFFIKQCLVILVTRLVICVVFVLHDDTLQNYSCWRSLSSYKIHLLQIKALHWLFCFITIEYFFKKGPRLTFDLENSGLQ